MNRNANELQLSIMDLEKKYMEKLLNMFQSQSFIDSIKLIESRIQSDYQYLSNHWNKKNKIDLAFERIVRKYIYKDPFSIDVYHSPISSDVSFYTEDALICLDMKTIDLDGNANDLSWINVERNQVSFTNIPLHSDPENNFSGIHYFSELPTIDRYTQKPLLTYFICLVYRDDKVSFNVDSLILSCIPNGELSPLYDFKFIDNYKTYRYITKTGAGFFQNSEALLPVNTIQDHWIDLDISISGSSYLDTNAIHPHFIDQNPEFMIRRKIGNQYRVLYSGDTARIKPDKIRDRYDSSLNPWIGYTKWSI